MKILVISQHYYPENFRITDICETLVKEGHIVDVLCGLPNYPEGYILSDFKHRKNREQVINGVNVHRCFEIGRKHNSINLFLNYYSVCLSMKAKARRIKDKFDIVLVNQLSPVMVSWAGIAYAKKHNVPCFMYCYDLWPDSLAAGGISNSSLIYKYFDKVSRDCYRRMDHIFVTSKCFINYLLDHHKIDRNKISYLPQYCEEQFLNIDTIKKNSDKYDYVFAGNIGKMQSVITILKAANEKKNDKSIHIHIVGDGSDLVNCKRYVLENELTNVTFHGRKSLEDMNFFYGMADAMIVTLSKNEVISKTLPGKVQSYMAAGKPIIASIDGETKSVLKEAKCGLYCDAEDYKELANIFESFKVVDKIELSQNARDYYIVQYNKKKIIFKMIEEMKVTINDRFSK